MTAERNPPDDAAMADIMASIRRIVTEDEGRHMRETPRPGDPPVLDLTEAMRLDHVASPGAPAPAAARSAPEAERGALSVDEATVADIVRAVLREEMAGPLGRDLTERMRIIAREEASRAAGPER